MSKDQKIISEQVIIENRLRIPFRDENTGTKNLCLVSRSYEGKPPQILADETKYKNSNDN